MRILYSKNKIFKIHYKNRWDFDELTPNDDD
jgi:hypothetical protein